MTQTFGFQSEAAFGMSFIIKVSREVTTPSSFRHPHRSSLVPTRNDCDHHLRSLNLLKRSNVNPCPKVNFQPKASVLSFIIYHPACLHFNKFIGVEHFPLVQPPVRFVRIHLRPVHDARATDPGPEQAAELLVLVNRSLGVWTLPGIRRGHQLLELVSPAGHLPLPLGLLQPLPPPFVCIHLDQVQRPPPPHHLHQPVVPPFVRGAHDCRQKASVKRFKEYSFSI